MQKGDVNAAADLVDFPVIMLSDDSKGVAKSFNASREQWVGIFTPWRLTFGLAMKMSGKHTPTFLSDTLVALIEQEQHVGKMKGKWNAMAADGRRRQSGSSLVMAERAGDMPAVAPAAAAKAASARSCQEVASGRWRPLQRHEATRKTDGVAFLFLGVFLLFRRVSVPDSRRPLPDWLRRRAIGNATAMNLH